MNMLDQIKSHIGEVSDEDIAKAISHGALQYSDDVSQMVSFAFWMCFMAEQDLKSQLEDGWAYVKEVNPDADYDSMAKILLEERDIKTEKIDPESDHYSDRDISFGDRIYIREQIFGKTNFVKLLWKLKNIRDDISHGRINDIEYGGAKFVRTCC